MQQHAARVLLVDDERLAREVYSDYLRAMGCEVDCAESAEAALAVFAPGRYQLLVTDLVMPGVDGIALLAEVKRRDPEIDAIVVTGQERVEPAVRALREGASEYLIKPVAPQALEVAVSRCLGLRRVVRENVALRSALSLVEAGRRTAAAADPVRMSEALLPALREESGARASLCFRLRGGSYELVRAEGLAEGLDEAAAAAADALAAWPDGAPGLADSPRESLPSALAGTRMVVVPFAGPGAPGVERAVEGGEGSLGGAVLWCPAAPGADALERIGFLARSAAVCMAASRRLDAASELVFRDDLTDLYNARYMHHVLDRETGREGGPRFAVLFLDLDHFKDVNDTHGHVVGSRVLVEVARTIRACVRLTDVCVRYGGDEFCVILCNADGEIARRIAERIRQAIAERAFPGSPGSTVRLTTSIGIALCPEHATTKEQLLHLADQAMYRGKRSSRDVVFVAEGDAAA